MTTKSSKFCQPSDKVIVDPEYCPEAVEQYTAGGREFGGRKATTTKAKKHLSSIGWTFYYALIKSGTKRELKYCSPSGKIFHSLLTACKSVAATPAAAAIARGKKRTCKSRLTSFESRAGSNYHQPAAYVFLEDGRSLKELRLRETKGRRKAVEVGTKDCSDDVCSVCQYGGELVLCDRCPSAFHTKCLGLKLVPDGDWFCQSCCCRICGKGRNGKNECSVLTCVQCEHRYHAECLNIQGIRKCYSEGGYWFCQDTCEQIFCSLRKILGKPIPVGTQGLTWTLLKYTKPDSDDDCSLESYRKLNVALSVMHECFEPVKQTDTGRDLVEDVIFSKRSELNRLNFRGFYTVVLEKNDDLISAAALRIHGKRVAEVPLVATRSQHRRLGFCRILMNELEKKLVELGVENLVLPAARGVLGAWTNSFRFSVMNETERLEFLDCTFLDFQDTTMCKKVLMNSNQSTGMKDLIQEEISDHMSEEDEGVMFDDIRSMSEFLLGDQVIVEDTELIDQKSTWWIDELLNI